MSKIRLYGSTSGYLELKAPAVAPDAEVEIPAEFGPYGKVLQVIQSVKTDIFSSSSSSAQDVPDLSVSITPTSSSSKVLVMATVHCTSSTYTNNYGLLLLRDSTVAIQGDAVGSRARNTMGGINYGSLDPYSMMFYAINYLDSPATTSATTYKIQTFTNTGTMFVNHDLNNDSAASRGTPVSTITAMEIGA